MNEKKIKVAIGFATGRKHFQRVLRSYVFNWFESQLVSDVNVGLNLFVAYDLEYRDTKRTDYTAIKPEVSQWLEGQYFYGKQEIEETRHSLVASGVITQAEASMLFRKGYAAQRNIILYQAIKNKMDCLLFLDDDEYPMAVTKTGDTALWGGQQVLKTHLKNIQAADITHGYHCGYISPIPYIDFSDRLPEDQFRLFVEAISNDILNWDNVKKVMSNGGVTYADIGVLVRRGVFEVPEIDRAKFISGSNLCINLTDPSRIFPFFNPPGARGEDTFLSTCLSERKVLRVPCYAFHDGFSSYNHLLSGVLPTQLKYIKPDSDQIIRRFYAACIGWIRYKPLLLYITDQAHYEDKIAAMTENLRRTLPLVCDYFHYPLFTNILDELRKYSGTVEKQYHAYEETLRIWAKIMTSACAE